MDVVRQHERGWDEHGIKVGHALAGGLLGGIAASALEIGARVAGVPMDLDSWLGGLLTSDPETALTIGVTLQVALFTAIALLYAVGFEYVARRGGWTVGLAFSLPHAAIAGVVLATLASPDAAYARPGSFPGEFTLVTTGLFATMHLVYGTIVAWLYGERRSGPNEVTQLEDSPKVGRTAASPDVDAGGDATASYDHYSRHI
jgi:hypothetical protein